MKAHLLVEYGHAEDQDFGEVCDLNELTEEQLREAVSDWLEPCPARPCGGHILRDENGGFHLFATYGDYKIVSGTTRKVIHQY